MSDSNIGGTFTYVRTTTTLLDYIKTGILRLEMAENLFAIQKSKCRYIELSKNFSNCRKIQ